MGVLCNGKTHSFFLLSLTKDFRLPNSLPSPSSSCTSLSLSLSSHDLPLSFTSPHFFHSLKAVPFHSSNQFPSILSFFSFLPSFVRWLFFLSSLLQTDILCLSSSDSSSYFSYFPSCYASLRWAPHLPTTLPPHVPSSRPCLRQGVDAVHHRPPLKFRERGEWRGHLPPCVTR